MIDSKLTKRPRKVRAKTERQTNMIRVYDEFAEAVKLGAGARRMTIADFCDRVLTPGVEADYRDHIRAEAARLAQEKD